ncbi:MAG: hypothetical protein EB084_25165, partial [Proteobacteria bacterium]|nr:hypothetical protein [Pseudomonadota bacterium]
MKHPPLILAGVRSPHPRAALRAVVLTLAAIITLLTGCGSGGGLRPGSPLTEGVTAAPAVVTQNLVVQLTFPAVVAKTASAAAPTFADTATVTVHVLDQTTHQDVVPPVTGQRPNGATTFDVTVPDVPVGTYDVYVQCFDANGVSTGDIVPTATTLSGQTVTVPVTRTVELMGVAVTPAQATVAVGGTQQ